MLFAKFRVIFQQNSAKFFGEIPRNNFCEISRNFSAKFREIIFAKFQEISRNFAKFREINCNFVQNFVFRDIKKSTFVSTLLHTVLYDVNEN
jgi:hypothetical protein